MGAIQGLDKFKFDASSESNIKSRQSGTLQLITLGSSTIDINEVDKSHSIVRTFPYCTTGSSKQLNSFAQKGELLSNTQLKISRSAAINDGYIYCDWEVIEFYSSAKIQSGLASASVGVELVVNVETYDLSKSLLFISYSDDSASTMNVGIPVKQLMKTSTSISFYCVSGGTKQIQWYLVSF